MKPVSISTHLGENTFLVNFNLNNPPSIQIKEINGTRQNGASQLEVRGGGGGGGLRFKRKI